MNEEKIPAVIYCRHSNRPNGDTSESCEIQEGILEQFAFDNGYDIKYVFKDKNVSGSAEDRPTLWRAIQCLDKGWVMLVWRRDRLARNVYLAEVISREVEKLGAKIVAVEGDVDGDGPEAKLIRQVLSSIAEYERKVTGLRTRAAMQQHQRNGKVVGRRPPYGYDIEEREVVGKDGPEIKKFLVPNRVEFPVMCEAVQKWRKWGENAKRVTKWLNTNRREQCRGREYQWLPVMKMCKREAWRLDTPGAMELEDTCDDKPFILPQS